MSKIPVFLLLNQKSFFQKLSKSVELKKKNQMIFGRLVTPMSHSAMTEEMVTGYLKSSFSSKISSQDFKVFPKEKYFKSIFFFNIFFL